MKWGGKVGNGANNFILTWLKIFREREFFFLLSNGMRTMTSPCFLPQFLSFIIFLSLSLHASLFSLFSYISFSSLFIDLCLFLFFVSLFTLLRIFLVSVLLYYLMFVSLSLNLHYFFLHLLSLNILIYRSLSLLSFLFPSPSCLSFPLPLFILSTSVFLFSLFSHYLYLSASLSLFFNVFLIFFHFLLFYFFSSALLSFYVCLCFLSLPFINLFVCHFSVQYFPL